MLALTVMVYYTLRMGQEANWKNFWCCAAGYLAALLLKANIAPYPVLALTYLLLRHYDRKLLGKQCIALAAVVLCFILPSEAVQQLPAVSRLYSADLWRGQPDAARHLPGGGLSCRRGAGLCKVCFHAGPGGLC